MPDQGDIAELILDEQTLEGGGDSPLRVDRSLPTPCADRWSREAGVGANLVLLER